MDWKHDVDFGKLNMSPYKIQKPDVCFSGRFSVPQAKILLQTMGCLKKTKWRLVDRLLSFNIQALVSRKQS